MTHTLSEARTEVARARMWGRSAPAWATEMVTRADTTVAEARLAVDVARTWGRTAPAWAAALVQEAEAAGAWLTAAGFVEEDVDAGIKLLESGRYLSVADLANSMLSDPGVSVRNPAVTRKRIASLAEVQSRGDH